MSHYDDAEQLRKWVSEADAEQIEAVLEFLYDRDLLKPGALDLRNAFNLKYIQENLCENCGRIEKDVIPVGDRPDDFLWMCKDCRTWDEDTGSKPEPQKSLEGVREENGDRSG